MINVGRGRTRLIEVAFQHNLVFARVRARGNQYEIQTLAIQHARQFPGATTAIMTQDGTLQDWRQTPANDARPLPGRPDRRVSRMAMLVDAARSAGTLRLDPILTGADSVEGAIPLETVLSDSGWRFSGPTLPRSIEELEAFGPPHGLPRLADGWLLACPQHKRTLQTELAVWQRKAEEARRAHQEPRNRFSLMWEIHHQPGALSDVCAFLSLPAPQRLPDAWLSGSSVRAAWVLPEERGLGRIRGLGGIGRPDIIQYQLLTQSTEGTLCLRTIHDTPNLDLLPVAACHSHVDTLYTRDDDSFGEWCRSNPVVDIAYSRPLLSVPINLPHKSLSSMTSYAAKMLSDVARDVCQELDPGLAASFTSIATYNVLHANGDFEKSTSRKQAAASIWGGLALLLDASAQGKALLRTVDARYKLQRSAARVLAVPLWVVRRLSTTPHDLLDILDRSGSTKEVSRLIHALGPQVRIRTKDDAYTIRAWLEQVLSWGQAIPGPRKEQDAFTAELVGRAVAAHGLGETHRVTDEAVRAGIRSHEVDDYLAFVLDCMRTVVAEHVDDAALNSRNARLLRAIRALFAGSSLVDLLRWAMRYHAFVLDTPLPLDDLPNGAPIVEVPNLLPVEVLPQSGWSVCQLRSQLALDNEGKRMRHCVATYGARVARHLSAIFSLVSPDAANRVTVEVDRGRVAGWRLIQARGFGNASVAPHSDAGRALDEFMRVLDEHAVPPETEGVFVHTAPLDDLDDIPYQTYLDRLLDAYGTRTWTMLRHMLPRSAHGHVEEKLWQAYCQANPDAPERQTRYVEQTRRELEFQNRWASDFPRRAMVDDEA